ncbi:MAG TPA: amino acid permease [Polyangia bacterium]|nr:amino acid permease [Polyangia bacterium]
MAAASGATDLRRVIGFWGGTALIIGITIGSGIFRKPATIAELVPDPRVALALWAALGLITICGALTLAELASMMPRTGGVYVYLREAYGEGAAFVFGWLYTAVTAPAAIAALATIFVEFFLSAVGAPIPSSPTGGMKLATAGTIAALAVVNILGTRLGSGVQALMTVMKTGALIAIIVVAFGLGQGSFSHLAPAAGATVATAALARAVASVIWAYDGWVGVSNISGEVVAPEKLLTRIIVTGMLVIVVLYLGANMAYIFNMPAEVMVREKAGIAARLMTGIVGPVGGKVIGICIMASVLGALSANLLAKPRVAYAMARDGLGFRFLGHAHARFATPDVAILVQAAVAIILVMALREFDTLTTYFVVVEWLALIFGVSSVFVLRKRLPDAPRPFRVPLYPVVPLIFVVGTAVGLAAIVWGEWQDGHYSPIIGLGIAAAGFPIYAGYKRLVLARA